MNRTEMITRIVAGLVSNPNFKDPTSSWSREQVMRAAVKYMDAILAHMKPIEEEEKEENHYNSLSPEKQEIYRYEKIEKWMSNGNNPITIQAIEVIAKNLGYTVAELSLLEKEAILLDSNRKLTPLALKEAAGRIADKLKNDIINRDYRKSEIIQNPITGDILGRVVGTEDISGMSIYEDE